MDESVPAGAEVRPVPGEVSEARRLACAALTRAVDPDDRDFRSLYPAAEPEVIWERLVDRDPALPPRLLDATRHTVRTADPARDLDRAAAAGGRLICRGDPEWPAALDDLGAKRPVALWARGALSLDEAVTSAVAVVGARSATPYGVQLAEELGYELGEAGWATVSGGAYGIDSAAHRGSLSAGAPTVAALACGIDVTYPSGNKGLFDRIAAAGVLVSEWPPGTSPGRLRFLWRNRLIAALSRGTVVVEMGLRSGAKRTCTYAERLNRHVMVVPGSVLSAASSGCHALLREGKADCVTGVRDVLALVGPLSGEVAPSPPPTQRDRLSQDAQRLLDVLDPVEFLGIEEIALDTPLDEATLETLLDALCESQLIVCSGGRYRLGAAALEEARRTA